MDDDLRVLSENMNAIVKKLEVSRARAGGIELRTTQGDVLLLRLE